MTTQDLAFEILSTRAGVAEPTAPTLADVTSAAEILESTTCTEPTAERFHALNVIKAAQDRITPECYVDFCDAEMTLMPGELDDIYFNFPALYWYDRAFEKVLEDVQQESVPAGGTVLWHIYNMGYVVKTAKHCFAIDLHHRRSEELLPVLDFIAITHNHDDHYTKRIAQGMNRAHKPVITNFYPNDGYNVPYPDNGYFKGPEHTLHLGDITVTTYEADHNVKLHKFVQPVEITCGTEENACVILSSGDTCDAKQLKHRSPKIDFHIVHPYVGLKVDEAANLLNPHCTLVSHLEEYHHSIDKWRWTWRQGYEAAQHIWQTGHNAIVPVCGDKIIFKLRNVQ